MRPPRFSGPGVGFSNQRSSSSPTLAVPPSPVRVSEVAASNRTRPLPFPASTTVAVTPIVAPLMTAAIWAAVQVLAGVKLTTLLTKSTVRFNLSLLFNVKSPVLPGPSEAHQVGLEIKTLPVAIGANILKENDWSAKTVTTTRLKRYSIYFIVLDMFPPRNLKIFTMNR